MFFHVVYTIKNLHFILKFGEYINAQGEKNLHEVMSICFLDVNNSEETLCKESS